MFFKERPRPGVTTEFRSVFLWKFLPRPRSSCFFLCLSPTFTHELLTGGLMGLRPGKNPLNLSTYPGKGADPEMFHLFSNTARLDLIMQHCCAGVYECLQCSADAINNPLLEGLNVFWARAGVGGGLIFPGCCTLSKTNLQPAPAVWCEANKGSVKY